VVVTKVVIICSGHLLSGSEGLVRNADNNESRKEELGIAMAGQVAQRGVNVLPVLIDDCEISSALRKKDMRTLETPMILTEL
jgi:hypothetical protein